jgi:hypothetical protein
VCCDEKATRSWCSPSAAPRWAAGPWRGRPARISKALTARRFGGSIGLRNAGPELLGLIDFVGLDDVVVAEDADQA